MKYIKSLHWMADGPRQQAGIEIHGKQQCTDGPEEEWHRQARTLAILTKIQRLLHDVSATGQLTRAGPLVPVTVPWILRSMAFNLLLLHCICAAADTARKAR